MAAAEHIDALRSFNRFYTRRLGLVRGGLVKTPHPLAEARVLYELSQAPAMQTSALKHALDVDAGQLSRLLDRLTEKGLIVREPHPTDARRRIVRLTDEGVEEFATLDQRTVEQVGELLDALPDQERLITALRDVH